MEKEEEQSFKHYIVSDSQCPNIGIRIKCLGSIAMGRRHREGRNVIEEEVDESATPLREFLR